MAEVHRSFSFTKLLCSGLILYGYMQVLIIINSDDYQQKKLKKWL